MKKNNSDPKLSFYEKRVLILAFSSTICAVMGVSSIAPDLPQIAEFFGTSQSKTSLLITMFTLPGVILSPVAGVLADRFGRKAILVPCLLIFSLAGASCGIISNFKILLLMRFIQGLGSVALGILNLIIIADTFDGEKRTQYVGYNMAILSVATGLFPVFGGFLSELSWRAPFILPLFVLPVFFLALKTPLHKPESTESLKNYILSTLRIIADPKIASLLFLSLITFIMLYGPLITNLPFLSHLRFEASPNMIGLVMMFNSAGTALISYNMSRLALRLTPWRRILIGQLFFAVALLWMPSISWFWLLVVPSALYGIGQGLVIPSVQLQLLNSVGKKQRAVLMSANAALLRLGQTLGPISFSSLSQRFGIDSPFLVGGCLPICTGVLILIVLARKKTS